MNSITSNICSTLEAYDEDHDGDRVVLFFCFLQELSVAPWEVLVLAEEALRPMKLMCDETLDLQVATLY
jgi:hypothetical protein